MSKKELIGRNFCWGDIVNCIIFTYDAAGRRTEMIDSTGTTLYNYDALNRLISVDGPGSIDTITYIYDSVGNRIEMTSQDGGVTEYSYDELNRLINLTDPSSQTTSYSYDALSNLIGTTLPNGTQANYAFDNLNRLLTLTNQKGQATPPAPEDKISSYNYNYNDSGMRTSVTLDDGSQINYQYDALNRLTSEIKTNPDGTEAVFNPKTLNVNSSGNWVTV